MGSLIANMLYEGVRESVGGATFGRILPGKTGAISIRIARLVTE